MDENEPTTTTTEQAVEHAEQAAEDHTSEHVPEEHAEQSHAEPTPEEAIAAMDHAETPSEVILTVVMKRMLFFALKDAEVKIMHGEQAVDTARTDKHGQASFKLKPGAYTIVSGDRNAGIELSKNSTVKL